MVCTFFQLAAIVLWCLAQSLVLCRVRSLENQHHESKLPFPENETRTCWLIAVEAEEAAEEVHRLQAEPGHPDRSLLRAEGGLRPQDHPIPRNGQDGGTLWHI